MNVIWSNEALQETKAIYNYYKFRVSIKVAESIKRKYFHLLKS